jgi:GR25 family glycosyltransferase involved in LPS biosynthesis
MKLFTSYDLDIDQAYIIRILGNEVSERFASRCAESCENTDMPYSFWDAYDGTNGEIKTPAHHNVIMDLIRITDHYLTRGEVACALSHISLWAKCAAQDKPLVILEHDAIMLQPYTKHSVYNSIAFLGSAEQVKGGWPALPTPPHGSDGPNKHFLCRAHAYAIDPAVAKNMLSHVIKFGITDPLDIMIRADIFPIHQIGVFAYDDPGAETTIHNRPKDGRTFMRNDGLRN